MFEISKMSAMAREGDVVRIDEVEMGEAGTADGILAREKEKFEYIHGHVEHQELHVPPLDELCKGRRVAMYSTRINSVYLTKLIVHISGSRKIVHIYLRFCSTTWVSFKLTLTAPHADT